MKIEEEIEISSSDFNSKLFELLNNNNDNDENICLITNKNLEDNHIELECGHKFNYGALYNEIYKQKVNKSYLEVTHLKRDQIKCPYCRAIQTGLLPYRDNFKKVVGVNHPTCLQFLPNKCIYVFSSGKRKNKECAKKCTNEYCNHHMKIMENRKKKKEKKEYEKLKKKQEKLKKENEKLKKEKENLLLDINLNDFITPDNVIMPIENDNMIITVDNMLKNINFYKTTQIKKLNKLEKINIIKKPHCCYIFKKGKNKGNYCKRKKIHQNGLCLTHTKMQMPKLNENVKL